MILWFLYQSMRLVSIRSMPRALWATSCRITGPLPTSASNRIFKIKLLALILRVSWPKMTTMHFNAGIKSSETCHPLKGHWSNTFLSRWIKYVICHKIVLSCKLRPFLWWDWRDCKAYRRMYHPHHQQQQVSWSLAPVVGPVTVRSKSPGIWGQLMSRPFVVDTMRNWQNLVAPLTL